MDSIVLRPVVPVTVVGTDVGNPVFALVDSGCEHVLAAPWVATAAGVDPRDSNRQIVLGLGGDNVRVRFLDLTLRLLAPQSSSDDDYIEWDDEVGFLEQWRATWPILLGQTSFMKQFTVTMSRYAQAIAIDEQGVFDRRYHLPLAR